MSSILCLFDWLQSAGHSRCSRYVLSSENDQRARHFSAEHANMGENESGNEQRVERHITVIIILIFFLMQYRSRSELTFWFNAVPWNEKSVR